jgi:hypothetical protein
MKPGLGPGRKWPQDAVKQFHPFTNLHRASDTHKPANVLDIKITLVVTAVLFAAALNLDMGFKRDHGVSKHDANLWEGKRLDLSFLEAMTFVNYPAG